MSGDKAAVQQLMAQAIEVDDQLTQLDAEIKDLEQFINDRPKQNNLTPLLLLIPFVLILAGGYWLYTQNQTQNNPQVACLPSGTKLRINGSTSMVNVNQKLKQLIETKCSGILIETGANGSDVGIQEVLNGKIDIAAVSRPLNSQEQAKDLIATYIKGDAIAVIVGNKNQFKQGLTLNQVADIFKGNITDWSQVDSQPGSIRVINRPPISGTHRAFQELVLKNANFGTNPNISTYPTDETTPIIKILKTDGISYGSYAQVNQTQVRIVPIDGLTPDSPQYPLKRQFFYIYKKPMSPTVKAFLDYLKSSEVQQVIEQN